MQTPRGARNAMAKKNTIVKKLEEERCLAVLRYHDQEVAAQAMNAAIAGGFRVVEFTLNTAGALDLIRDFSEKPDLTVGAGTVLNVADAKRAIECGARFLVSPVVDEAVIDVAREASVPVVPGCMTPTELQRAHVAGAPLQKLFPAPGPEFVQACLGPLPHLRIVPTSGVTLENATDYLRAGAVAVGFVSPLFDSAELARRDWASVEARARALITQVKLAGAVG